MDDVLEYYALRYGIISYMSYTYDECVLTMGNPLSCFGDPFVNVRSVVSGREKKRGKCLRLYTRNACFVLLLLCPRWFRFDYYRYTKWYTRYLRVLYTNRTMLTPPSPPVWPASLSGWFSLHPYPEINTVRGKWNSQAVITGIQLIILYLQTSIDIVYHRNFYVGVELLVSTKISSHWQLYLL